jgi:hypothetical protein
MALTQVSTDGVKNDAITKTKIPANQIEASELADNAVDTNAIADQAVALSKLPHGTSSNDGKFLRANNGADPSFETVTSTTINNNADNRVITGSGTANTLNGEAGLLFDGTNLGLGITPDSHNASVKSLQIGTVTNLFNETSDDYTILGNNIYFHSGGTNKRIKAQECSRIMMNAGEFVFERAGADSADSNITFTRHFKIDANGNAFVENPSEARLQVKTPSNGIIALRADGGNTQLGTWSDHDLKIVRNSTIKASFTSNGLCFNSDTAAANALDDYEEGTWTPVLKSGNNTISYSGGSPTFRYTKIGNMVYVNFTSGGTTTSGTTGGDFAIEGLPFTSISSSRHIGSIINNWGSGLQLTSNFVYIHLNAGTATIHPYSKSTSSSGGNYSHVQVNGVGNSTHMQWSLVYQAA